MYLNLALKAILPRPKPGNEAKYIKGCLVPRPPPFSFFGLRSIIHGGGRARKTRFSRSSAAVYYTEHKPKNEGLGTRLHKGYHLGGDIFAAGQNQIGI